MSDQREPRRRFLFPVLLVAALALVGALAGLIGAAARGTTWVSEAQLTWDPSVRAQLDEGYAAPDLGTFDRQVADQRDVVLSDAVVGAVATAVDETPAAVRDQVTVTTTAGSAAFTIAATGDTPADARRVARATTDAYVATLQARNTTGLQARIDELRPVIAELRRQLQAGGAAAAAPLAAEIADLQSDLASYSVVVEDVPVEATVQRAAVLPIAPSSLNPLTQAVIGAGLGAILAICILLLLASRARGTAAPVRPMPQRTPARTDAASSGAAAPAAVVATAAPASAQSAPGDASRPQDAAPEAPTAEAASASEGDAVDGERRDGDDRGRLSPSATPSFFE